MDCSRPLPGGRLCILLLTLIGLMILSAVDALTRDQDQDQEQEQDGEVQARGQG